MQLWVVAIAALVGDLCHSTRTLLSLPKNYKDIFSGTQSGRPTFGTAKTTCWARGGVCVDMRECPALVFDGTVAGCMHGFKVCCKSFQRLPPTVTGKGWRRSNAGAGAPIAQMDDFDQHNTNIMNAMADNNLEMLKYIADF